MLVGIAKPMSCEPPLRDAIALANPDGTVSFVTLAPGSSGSLSSRAKQMASAR